MWLQSWNGYHIPQTHKCIDSVEWGNVFFKLNAKSGFWQIELDDNNMNGAAFARNDGLYRNTHI